MEAEQNKKTLKLLADLKEFKSKGQIIYELRLLKVPWKTINDTLGGNGCSLAGKWCRTHGKVWPV